MPVPLPVELFCFSKMSWFFSTGVVVFLGMHLAELCSCIGGLVSFSYGIVMADAYYQIGGTFASSSLMRSWFNTGFTFYGCMRLLLFFAKTFYYSDCYRLGVRVLVDNLFKTELRLDSLEIVRLISSGVSGGCFNCLMRTLLFLRFGFLLLLFYKLFYY